MQVPDESDERDAKDVCGYRENGPHDYAIKYCSTPPTHAHRCDPVHGERMDFRFFEGNSRSETFVGDAISAYKKFFEA